MFWSPFCCYQPAPALRARKQPQRGVGSITLRSAGDGSDRTGYMVAAYRMQVCGWSADEALNEMHAFGLNAVWLTVPPFVRSVDPNVLNEAIARAPSPRIASAR